MTIKRTLGFQVTFVVDGGSSLRKSVVTMRKIGDVRSKDDAARKCFRMRTGKKYRTGDVGGN
jgi:hypothetical protein